MLLRRLAKTLEAGPGLFRLRAVGATVTALVESDSVILVDAGSRGSLPLIERGLQRIGSSVRDVQLIVVTHYHPDHAGGLASLARATGAPDYAPALSGRGRQRRL